jgi:hypothetical protein
MKLNRVPTFIAQVLTQVQAGIDLYNAGTSTHKAGWPKEIEIHMDIHDDDDHYYQTWMKVPFETYHTRS